MANDTVSPDRLALQGSGNLLMEISNALVRLHKDFYGRGPTKARAHLDRELLVVILQGGLSQSEKVLQQHGRGDAVVTVRAAMQGAIEDAWISAVQELLGRKVWSFMSAVDAANDVEAEVFLLEPDENAKSPEDDLACRARFVREQSAELRSDLRALRAEQVQARAALRKRPGAGPELGAA